MPPFERARVLGWLGDVGWIEGGGGWNEHFGVGGLSPANRRGGWMRASQRKRERGQVTPSRTVNTFKELKLT